MKTGVLNKAHRVAAARWSSHAGDRAPSRANWWNHPAIVRHVNEAICGQPVGGMAGADAALLRQHLDGRTLDRGVSIGCGSASKELALLRTGVVERFDLFEISEERIAQGEEAAAGFGLGNRVTWHNEVVDFSSPSTEADLVYWNNALHHMLDTTQAIAWSLETLRPGGVFYMNDFVGPNRMQWPEAMLDVAERARAALPARLRRDANGKELPVRLDPPDPDWLAERDPTECADSEAIIPGIRRYFPGATIKPIGGVIYHLALQGVLDNLTDEDHVLLELLLLADDLCAAEGLTHYAVALADR